MSEWKSTGEFTQKLEELMKIINQQLEEVLKHKAGKIEKINAVLKEYEDRRKWDKEKVNG